MNLSEIEDIQLNDDFTWLNLFIKYILPCKSWAQKFISQINWKNEIIHFHILHSVAICQYWKGTAQL